MLYIYIFINHTLILFWNNHIRRRSPLVPGCMAGIYPDDVKKSATEFLSLNLISSHSISSRVETQKFIQIYPNII